MSNLYIIDFAMQAGCKMEKFLAVDIAKKLTGHPDWPGITKTIEECEDDCLELKFRSSYMPSEMIARLATVMEEYKYLGVYYADMKYAYAYDLNSDRIVIWADGRRQTYRGRIDWSED